jgi:hypothetical protein
MHLMARTYPLGCSLCNFTKASLTCSIFITGLLGDIIIVNHEITTIKYEFESESLQMTERDCPKLDINGILLLKDVSV